MLLIINYLKHGADYNTTVDSIDGKEDAACDDIVLLVAIIGLGKIVVVKEGPHQGMKEGVCPPGRNRGGGPGGTSD